MPMPLSTIVKVLAALSGMMWMKSSGWASSLDLSVRLSKRILSKAYTKTGQMLLFNRD